MNIKLLAVLLTFIIIGCQKIDVNEYCHQMGTNRSFVEEDFKPNYTIQFPNTYVGEGLHFLYTPVFFKSSPSGVIYSYKYLCATDCHIYFGQILETPLPSKILYSDYTNKHNGEILDKRINFCINQELFMVLYYSSNGFNKSKLFIKDKGEFKEGLIVEFGESNIDEVIAILKTIKRK